MILKLKEKLLQQKQNTMYNLTSGSSDIKPTVQGLGV